jgi:heat shock protein HslJ
MKKLLMAIAIALTSSVCSTCSSSEQTQPFGSEATTRAKSEQAELFDTDWLLEKLLISDEPLPSDSLMILSFKGDYVGGYGGCNDFGGRREDTVYDRSVGRITFFVEKTLNMCEYSKFERVYLGGLVRVRAYESDGRILTLIDDEGRKIAVYGRYYSTSP